jgi:hypothetical protein
VRWLHDVLDGANFPDMAPHPFGSDAPWADTVKKETVYRSYRRFCKTVMNRQPQPESVFHQELAKVLPSLEKRRVAVKGVGGSITRERRYVLPPLSEARGEFERYMKAEGQVPWNDVDELTEPDGSTDQPVRPVQGGAPSIAA